MAGYRFISALGGLIGLNIYVYLMDGAIKLTQVQRNLISEGLMFMGFLSILFEILPKQYKTRSIWYLPTLAILFGYFWETLSFLSVDGKLLELIIEWTKYGIPAILLLGVPLMLFGDFMSYQKKIFDIKIVKPYGLIYTFILAIPLSIMLFIIYLNII